MSDPAPVAVVNGRLVPRADVAIPIDDLTVTLGVNAVEQLRTYAGRLPLWDQHMARLQRGLRWLELESQIDLAALRRDVDQVVQRNRPLLPAGGELGISILISPGLRPGGAPSVDRSTPPNIVVTSFALPLAGWQDELRRGVRLATATLRDIPAACLPKDFKHRSRMHYYLAQAEVERRSPGCRALLLTLEGQVAGGATGGLMAWFPGTGWLVPPPGIGLHSVTLEVLGDLAAEAGWPVQPRGWRLEELSPETEVIWCSTPTGPLSVSEIDGRSILRASPRGTEGSGDRGGGGPQYERLAALWRARVGQAAPRELAKSSFRGG